MYKFGLSVIFLLYWIVPYFSSFQLINWICELSEHYGKMSNEIDICMSRNRIGIKLENFFFGIHNENFHLVHHINPAIPFWNLDKAHLVYLKDSEYNLCNGNAGGIFSEKYGISTVENILDFNRQNI
jgi:fatty acid desaturase